MSRSKRESGQTIIEYILMVAVMIILATVVMKFVKSDFQKFAQALVWRVAQPCASCEETDIPKPNN